MYMVEGDHQLNFSEAHVIAQCGNKGIRLINVSWFSEITSINSLIDQHPNYQALRATIVTQTESQNAGPAQYIAGRMSETDVHVSRGSSATPIYHAARDSSPSPEHSLHAQPGPFRFTPTGEQVLNTTINI